MDRIIGGVSSYQNFEFAGFSALSNNMLEENGGQQVISRVKHKPCWMACIERRHVIHEFLERLDPELFQYFRDERLLITNFSTVKQLGIAVKLADDVIH